MNQPIPHVDQAALAADSLAAFDALPPGTWIARSSRGYEVFSHAGVEAAYQDRGLVTAVVKQLADMGVDPGMLTGGGGSMQTNEGPDHFRFRRVVSRWFTPRAVDALRPRVRARAAQLVAPLTEAGRGDFISDVASRVPGPVFCWMMGAPETEGDRLFRVSEVILEAFDADLDNIEGILAAAGEMGEFIDALIEAKRAEPADDLMSVLLAAADAGEISIEDVRSLSFELLSASTDNTAHSAAASIYALAHHQDEYGRLRAERDLLPSAVEECMRVAPRMIADPHYTDSGVTLFDVEIPPDSFVYLHTMIANLDPAIYEDPRRFDISRNHPRPQLNFGVGRHFCLGAALARMELQEILGTVCDAWTEIALDGDPEIVRKTATAFNTLPLRVTAA